MAAHAAADEAEDELFGDRTASVPQGSPDAVNPAARRPESPRRWLDLQAERQAVGGGPGGAGAGLPGPRGAARRGRRHWLRRWPRPGRGWSRARAVRAAQISGWKRGPRGRGCRAAAGRSARASRPRARRPQRPAPARQRRSQPLRRSARPPRPLAAAHRDATMPGPRRRVHQGRDVPEHDQRAAWIIATELACDTTDTGRFARDAAPRPKTPPRCSRPTAGAASATQDDDGSRIGLVLADAGYLSGDSLTAAAPTG